MSASSGVGLGHGTMVRIGRGSGPNWTELIGFDDVNFPDQDAPDVDATHLRSPGNTEESIRGLKPVATLVLALHYVPGSETDQLLTELEALGDNEDFILEITPSGGSAHTWVAYCHKYRMSSAPAKDKKMAEVTFKVKMKLSSGGAAAPVNTVVPGISGVAAVGTVLTAWPGVWQPSGVLTYQWQVYSGGEWANIAGAVQQTYTPISGDVGKTLRIMVTATTNGGAVSASSAASAAVVS